MIPDTTAVRAIRAAPRTRCCTRFKHTSITASTSVLYSQILHGREQAWHMYTCICELWSGSITSLRTRTVRTKRYGGRQGGQGKVVRLQPSRFGRDSCSVERMACAHALEVFFGGSGKDDFPVFYLRHCFVPSIFRKKNEFFAHTYLFENGPACHNSGFPVQGKVWGTLPSTFGRAACRVPCVTRCMCHV